MTTASLVRATALAIALVAVSEAPSQAGSAYSPSTTTSEQTAINTSASPLFTDTYYSFNAGGVVSNANGDMIPAHISNVPIRSLFSFTGAQSTKIFAYTQDWFCHSSSNVSSTTGLLDPGTTPKTPICGSHIDVGYNSGDASQVQAAFADMQRRGIDGVVIDWDGPPALSTGPVTVQNNAAVNQFMSLAQGSGGNFAFAVVLDEGLAGCVNGWWPCHCANGSTGSSCNGTTETIYEANYLINTWAGSPAYLHSGGQPVIYSFGLDGYDPNLDWAAIVAGLDNDPKTGKAPLLVFENSASHAGKGGAYSWVSPTPFTSYSTASDPFALKYLSYEYGGFLSTLASDPSYFVSISGYKGFDDTVVNGWGSLTLPAKADDSRYIDQQCGQTWLQSVAQANSSFHGSVPVSYFAIPTWDDYEEATEVETGIDNCLSSLGAAVSGGTVSWSPVFGKSLGGVQGSESTVHHYVVYLSADGENLMPVGGNIPSGTHSLNLSGLGITTMGTYRVFVQAVGQPMIRNTLAAAEGNFTVAPTAGTISGQITNASTGTGVSGATVSYSGGSTTTGSSGQYTLSSVSPGTYTIQASASGFLANSISATVTAGATTTANLPIATAGILTGTVASASGASLSNASVTISGGVIAQNLSYSGASFNTSWIPIGNYTVTCASPSYVTQQLSITLTAGATATAACSLTPTPGTIQGTITNASTGAAISGATVSYSGGSATTNSSGQYSLTGVQAGTYTVKASASGFLPNTGSVAVTAGGTVALSFPIATAGILSGTVQNSSGTALSSAAVSIAGGVIAQNLSYSGSSFNTSWIPVGNYTVTCSSSGYVTQQSSVTLAAGATVTVACSLKPQTGTISGQITNASTGTGISGATVSFSGGSTTTNSSGSYGFTGVQPGTYTLTATSSGFLTNTGSASVSSGAVTTTNVKIATAGILTGTVKSTSGAKLSSAKVTVTGGVISQSLSYTGGSFDTSWIPVGSYTISCSSSGYVTKKVSLTLTAGVTSSVSCALAP